MTTRSTEAGSDPGSDSERAPASGAEGAGGKATTRVAAPAQSPPSRGQGRWRELGTRLTAGLSRTVVVLGVLSLFTDVASEMIMPLRLLFLVQVLSIPLALAGLIEGIAESATSILKVVSGRLADHVDSRRSLVVLGYSLSNVAKPLLALAANWPTALGLVLLDRAGKATRGSPRDAMLADATPIELRGKAFGFHRAADTLGAAIGPLVAAAVLAATGGNLRAVFGWTLLPGALAVLGALLFLRVPRWRSAPRSEPAGVRKAPLGKFPELVQTLPPPGSSGAAQVVEQRHAELRPQPISVNARSRVRLGRRARQVSPQQWPRAIQRAARMHSPAPFAESSPALRPWQGLGSRFWLFAAVATVFALGNSSDAFLFLRTEGLEASLAAVPLIYFVFNLVYAVLATPLGALSDRFGRLPVLAAGYAAFTLVYLGWVHASAGWQAWALFSVYGVYYAATDGVARAFVCDLVPGARKGAALGAFNGLVGFVALPANVVGAWLWSEWGAQATFAMGAWLGAVALGLLLAWWPWLRGKPTPWHGKVVAPHPA